MAKLHLLLSFYFNSTHNIDPSLFHLFPRSYKRVGHIAIINLHNSLLPYKYEIGEGLLKILGPSIKTVARFSSIISGMTRKPDVEWLAGSNDFSTIHKEYQTLFSINAKNLMLSAGNHNERKRMVDFIRNLEIPKPIIVDMFSCVGNLSLPIGVHCRNAKVIAVEVNPVAVDYLNKSITLNKIEKNFEVILGDNRQVTPQNIADVVILGYFGIDFKQLLVAINALKKETGGWLLIHDIGRVNEKSKVINDFSEIMIKNTQFKINDIKKRIIKSIGPKLEHWVFEVRLKVKSQL